VVSKVALFVARCTVHMEKKGVEDLKVRRDVDE